MTWCSLDKIDVQFKPTDIAKGYVAKVLLFPNMGEKWHNIDGDLLQLAVHSGSPEQRVEIGETVTKL